MDADLHLLHCYHCEGDILAFQELVDTHAGMVHATASRVTRDAALAQDVAQETFLALARSSGAAIQSVGAWLHHVAWQKACDQVRSKARRHKYEAAAAEHLHQPPQEATWAELEPLLDEALEQLAAPARDLIIQRFLVGRTQQELADCAGLSQSTISRLITRALKDLRAILRSKGVACGSGFAVLLGARGVQAAPPALVASLGKLSLSSVGVAVSTLPAQQLVTSTLMTISASKMTIVTAALLLFGTVAYDLGSAEPWLLSRFRNPATTGSPHTAPNTGHKASSKASTLVAATSEPAPPAAAAATTTSPGATSDSPATRLAKLSRLKKEADFKLLVLKLFGSGDPRHVARELKRLMGIDFTERDVANAMKSPTSLEASILLKLAREHPQEMLAWMAMLDGNNRLMTDVVYPQIFKGHPEITAESIAATLPAGPSREQVLSHLRAQRDPVAEAQRIVDTIGDPLTRLDRLWKIADLWPADRSDEAVEWALAHLSGQELETFLPRTAHHLSTASPDAALALMSQITDPKLLSKTLAESLHGLVHQHSRMADVVVQIGRLEGRDRTYAIAELSRRWVRVDQQGLIEWMNTLVSAADWDAALPMTLPQLTPENYTAAINTVMSQLDGTIDAALIKAATPDFSGTTRTTVDIIHRLTQLPQYSTIGSGQLGNRELLWQAVNQAAAGWVTRQGGKPAEGAQWIDSLTFNAPADKAVVAAKLYDQWKVSDPTSAAAWATAAGVKLP